jgi:hypothetical protein
MKKIIALIIIGLMLTGILIFEPFRTEPPTPIVTAGNNKIKTTQGSYCWGGLLRGQCVDKIYSSPIDMANQHKSTAVSPNEKIKIEFKKDPIDGTIEVEQWINKENIEKIEVINDSFLAPKEKGIYVYYLRATWKQGDGNYAFRVEVK